MDIKFGFESIHQKDQKCFDCFDEDLGGERQTREKENLKEIETLVCLVHDVGFVQTIFEK